MSCKDTAILAKNDVQAFCAAATHHGIHLLGTFQWDWPGVWSGTNRKPIKSKLRESGPNLAMYGVVGQ